MGLSREAGLLQGWRFLHLQTHTPQGEAAASHLFTAPVVSSRAAADLALMRAAQEDLQQDGPCERPITCQCSASKIESCAAKPLIPCVPTAGRCRDNYDLTGLEL